MYLMKFELNVKESDTFFKGSLQLLIQTTVDNKKSLFHILTTHQS